MPDTPDAPQVSSPENVAPASANANTDNAKPNAEGGEGKDNFVPYSRFQEVIKAKNDAIEQAKQATTVAESVQAEMAKMKDSFAQSLGISKNEVNPMFEGLQDEDQEVLGRLYPVIREAIFGDIEKVQADHNKKQQEEQELLNAEQQEIAEQAQEQVDSIRSELTSQEDIDKFSAFAEEFLGKFPEVNSLVSIYDEWKSRGNGPTKSTVGPTNGGGKPESKGLKSMPGESLKSVARRAARSKGLI